MKDTKAPTPKTPGPESGERLTGTLAGGIGRMFGGLGRAPQAIRGVSAVVAVGGVALLLIGLGMYIFVGDLRTFGLILMGLGGLFVLAAIMTSTRAVVAAATGRQGRYGTNTFVMIVAFVGIAALVNFLAFQSTARLDMTAGKEFSLASRSEQLLKELKDPVKVTAFFRSIDPDQAAIQAKVEDLLREFKRRNSGKFSYQVLDPDVDTVTAQEYGVTQYGTIIFEDTGTNRRQPIFVATTLANFVPGALEQDFVTGLLIATGTEQKRVYFVTGHGEHDVNDSTNAEGAALLYEGVQRDNYQTFPVNLTEQGDIPTNAALVIVDGPKTDFSADELAKLDTYLKSGGRLIALVDPETPQSFKDYLAKWGITVEQGQVIDTARNVNGDPKIPLLRKGQYLSMEQLTSQLDATFYAGVASLKATNNTVQFAGLAQTTSQSCRVTDLSKTTCDGESPGPFYLVAGVVATAPVGETPAADAKRATIFVFGDSDFTSNRYFSAFHNGDFILNSVNWLTGDLSLVSLRPKVVVFRPLILTKTEREFIRYSTWLLLPLAMLSAAGLVWWRRR